MDLRKQKTLRSIHNAFIELRSKKPLYKITIKELTEKAMISKPTFYLHYHDIYDLSDCMENEVINDIIMSCPITDISKSFASIQSVWLTNLFEAFLAQGQLLNILFSEDRKYIFVSKINSAFKNEIFNSFPKLKDNVKLSLYIDYTVHGVFQTYIQNNNLPQDVLINTLVSFTDALFLHSISDIIHK